MDTLLKVGSGTASAPAWSPLDLPSLALWLDASDAATRWQDASATTPADADAEPVRRIDDKSGSANHLVAPADAQRPLVKAAIRNGLDCLDFDGSNDLITRAFTLAQPATVFLAGFLRAVGGSGANDGVADGGGFASAALLSYTATSTQMYGGASLTSNAAAALSSWQVLTVKWNGASSLLRIDGVQLMSGNAGTRSPGGFTLGGLPSGGGRYTQLRFGELAVCAADVTGDDLDAAEAYFLAKWG